MFVNGLLTCFCCHLFFTKKKNLKITGTLSRISITASMFLSLIHTLWSLTRIFNSYIIAFNRCGMTASDFHCVNWQCLDRLQQTLFLTLLSSFGVCFSLLRANKVDRRKHNHNKNEEKTIWLIILIDCLNCVELFLLFIWILLNGSFVQPCPTTVWCLVNVNKNSLPLCEWLKEEKKNTLLIEIEK